jgi:membrane-bound ClpP family serine protease
MIAVAALAVGLALGAALGYALGRRAHVVITNASGIVGKRVKVISGAPEDQEAVVLLTGEHWKARSAAGALEAGHEARVVALDGLCLIVVPERSS